MYIDLSPKRANKDFKGKFSLLDYLDQEMIELPRCKLMEYSVTNLKKRPESPKFEATFGVFQN